MVRQADLSASNICQLAILQAVEQAARAVEPIPEFPLAAVPEMSPFYHGPGELVYIHHTMGKMSKMSCLLTSLA